MDEPTLHEAYRGRRILVTGGTGSIGSQIVRRLLAYEPRVLRVLSRDETRQAYMARSLGRRGNLRFLIGDVRDRDRLRRALDGVEVVFHAAALKHVPICEYNPFEAVQTNVLGTQNLIQASADAGAGKLVVISTDKAVSPTNTMGATKLLAERLVQAAQAWMPSMILCCVRFGNVLGSRGSLVPFVRRQLAETGHAELTHRDSTRFFMTATEAVDLVLAAGARSRGGELFVLPMSAARVADLVEILVGEGERAKGHGAGALRIVETGLRPGERLHERLVSPEDEARVRQHEGLLVLPPPWGDDWDGVPVDSYRLSSETCAQLTPHQLRAMLRSLDADPSAESTPPSAPLPVEVAAP